MPPSDLMRKFTRLEHYSKVCEGCRVGAPVRQRSDTKEWVHEKRDYLDPKQTSFRIRQWFCLATALRNEDMKNG